MESEDEGEQGITLGPNYFPPFRVVERANRPPLLIAVESWGAGMNFPLFFFSISEPRVFDDVARSFEPVCAFGSWSMFTAAAEFNLFPCLL